MDALLNVEFAILDTIAKLHNPALDIVMKVITSLGNGGFIWIVTGLVLILIPKYRKGGCMVLITLALGFLIGNLGLKLLLARERPFTLNDTIELLITAPKDYSFPSGHTLSSFDAAFILYHIDKKRLGIPALIMASLIAFSRMYFYVHYPTDILCAILLAAVIAGLVIWFSKQPQLSKT